MNRISRCDWLPERARWRDLARSGYGLCPASTQIMLWCFIPYNKSFMDQACSVKMTGYWPRFFCVFMDRDEVAFSRVVRGGDQSVVFGDFLTTADIQKGT